MLALLRRIISSRISNSSAAKAEIRSSSRDHYGISIPLFIMNFSTNPQF